MSYSRSNIYTALFLFPLLPSIASYIYPQAASVGQAHLSFQINLSDSGSANRNPGLLSGRISHSDSVTHSLGIQYVRNQLGGHNLGFGSPHIPGFFFSLFPPCLPIGPIVLVIWVLVDPSQFFLHLFSRSCHK